MGGRIRLLSIVLVVVAASISGAASDVLPSSGLHLQSALAADAVVSECTEAGFDAALNTV